MSRVQVHKVVCRYETRKRNWGYVVCEGKDCTLTSENPKNGKDFLE